MIVGQTKLLEKLNKFNLKTLPHSIIITGEKGCGKHLITNYLANKMGVSLLDITSSFSENETLTNISLNPFPTMYLIDLSNINLKFQNSLLKLLEEPNDTCYLVLLCEGEYTSLTTIFNRCIQFKFSPYTKEELSNFTKNEVALDILHTPGQILGTNLNTLNNIVDTCNKIIDNMSTMSFTDALKIVNYINYDDNYDKFDIKIFFNVLIYSYKERYISSLNDKFYNSCILIEKKKNGILNTSLNYKTLMQNFVTELWCLNHD